MTSTPSSSTKTPDPRHIITADAFRVDEALLGLALASPRKRAIAMAIDLLLIQQLSHIGNAALGLATVALLYLLSRSKGKKAIGTVRSTLFKTLAIITLLYVIAVEYLNYQENHQFTLLNHPSTESLTRTNNADATLDDSLEKKQTVTLSTEEIIDNLQQENRVLKANDDSDVMDILEALANKFGYGFGWAGLYFTLVVYLLNGQTLGKWLMRIKIIQLDGKKIGIWSAFRRYGGYAASVVTGLSGFFQIYWDPNRQGLHDKVSSTVVIKLS